MSVDNHRHCQATVLGATGSGQGNGSTWHTISDLIAPNLDAIQSNWKSSFLANKNITDDLADILALINTVAGRIQPPTEIYEGDLISIVGTTISVKNDIENGYSGPIGLTGRGDGRKLVKQEFSATTTGDGNQIATITFGGKTYPIKESAQQTIPNFSVQTTGTGNQIATITFGGQTYPIKESATPNFAIVDHGDSDGDLLAEITYGDQHFEIHAKKSQGGDNIFKVTFKYPDETLIREAYVLRGQPAPEPDVQWERNGQSFSGWDKDIQSITEDTVVHAIYVDRYVVSEDHNDDILLSGTDDGVFLDYQEPGETRNER